MSEANVFGIACGALDRFMGRYTPSLAAALASAAGVVDGQRVLDVGCGPGGLTSELAARTGAERVAAIDPASQFVAACAVRNPGVDARQGVAEQLPWEDSAFDAALSCLVIGFMRAADRGVREMARVTRPNGTVAICMWDIAGDGMKMLHIFWSVIRDLTRAFTVSSSARARGRAISPTGLSAPASPASPAGRWTPTPTTPALMTSGTR